jgi:CHAT domain-containing protein
MVAGAAAAHAHSSRSEARALLAQLTRLRARLNQLYYRAIPPARAEEHARLMRELSEQRSGLEAELARVVHWESRASTPEQVVAALADDTVLVDILYYDRDTLSSPGVPKFQIEPRYTAFVLRKGQPIRRIELGPARPIEQAIRAWRDRLEAGAGDADAAGRAVAWLVWEPLAPRLAGARTVLVAPDAVTCFLPWAALPDREPGTYLLQRYTFSTVGSARALVQHADARPTPAAGGLLTVGGVDYGRADSTPAQPPRLARRAAPIDRGALAFVALPGTKTEAEAISNLYERNAGSQATRVSGPEASKPRLGVLMAGKRYLHLATHGYFAPPEIRSALAPADDPSSLRPFVGMGRREAAGWYPGLLSGLVWAGINHPPTDPILGEPDPGACLMTAEEVAGLDLSACDLAVLSACETGLGQVAGGEGVLGLQRAFHQAGARTVVASLWKVDDAATSVLMEEFYTNLWQRKLPKLEALRRAQIAVLEHPEWVERRAAESQADGPVRGLGRKSEPLPRGGPVARRSPPKWWAGFVLSGDPR